MSYTFNMRELSWNKLKSTQPTHSTESLKSFQWPDILFGESPEVRSHQRAKQPIVYNWDHGGNYGPCQKAFCLILVYRSYYWGNAHETKTVTPFRSTSLSTHELKSNFFKKLSKSVEKTPRQRFDVGQLKGRLIKRWICQVFNSFLEISFKSSFLLLCNVGPCFPSETVTSSNPRTLALPIVSLVLEVCSCLQSHWRKWTGHTCLSLAHSASVTSVLKPRLQGAVPQGQVTKLN